MKIKHTLAVIIISTLLFACKKTEEIPDTPQNLLIGTWKIDKESSAATEISGEEIELENSVLPAYLKFTRDGQYQVWDTDHWKISDYEFADPHHLKVASFSADTITYNIIYLDKKKLVLQVTRTGVGGQSNSQTITGYRK
ncbi:hypothetical protein [Rubrolithibacter danxiaensis]|uniref:hypothetical protein n=1 Tax=Rubrolithibacter danxiaensis TaxID=3390805 RepID=UPI003BF8D1B6